MHSLSLADPVSKNEKASLSVYNTYNVCTQTLGDFVKQGVSSDNIAFALRINGIIDELAIDHAFKLLIKKNSAFRCNYIIKGNVQQQIFKEKDNIRIIEFVDKSEADIITDNEYLAYTQKIFDIENDSLLRITLIKYSPYEYVLLATAHKMVCDLYSLKVLLKQFCDIYPHIIAGRSIVVSEDFKDYREKVSLFTKKYNTEKNIKSFEPLGKFLHDRFTDVVHVENENFFSYYPFRFGEEIDSLLKNKSEVFSSTIYMLILAAYKITLSLKTGLEEIPVIAPFVDRNPEIEPILLGNFNYNLLCETKIEDFMTLSDVMNNVKKSVLGMVGFNGQSLPTYVSDLNILNKHAAFSWDVASDISQNDGIYVIVDPKNNENCDPIVSEPLFVKQESCPFTINLIFKRDKNGQLFGSFLFDVNKISRKKIENIYVQFYKILFVLLNNQNLTILELKNINMVDTILTYKKDALKENSILDIEKNLRKVAIQY